VNRETTLVAEGEIRSWFPGSRGYLWCRQALLRNGGAYQHREDENATHQPRHSKSWQRNWLTAQMDVFMRVRHFRI